LRLYSVLIAAMVVTLFIFACGGDAEEPQVAAPATAEPTAAATAEPTEEPKKEEPKKEEPKKETPKPTAAPTKAAPKATPVPEPVRGGRLKFTSTAGGGGVESVLSWKGNAAAVGLQARPFAEDLVQSDNATGEGTKVGLTTNWSMASDGLSWTYTLKEDVPFHFGYGEFTGKDVVHSLLRLTNPEALSTQGNLYKALLGDTDEEITASIALVTDHTMVFNFKAPGLGFLDMTRNLDGNTYIYSKDQYDEVGQAKMEAYVDNGLRIAGTGPFEFVEQKIQEHILYEAVDEHHRQTANFEELEFIWVAEASTRLAMLLTGQADMALITRDQYPQAVSAGMDIVSCTRCGVGQVFYFYNWDDQFPDGTRGSEGPYENPLLDIKVREAIIHAIDEEGLMVAMIGERGNPQYMHSAQPGTPGFQQRFIDEWDDKYGYDPARSKALLAEAGYAAGDVEITLIATPHTNPENVLASEIIAPMLNEVGISTNIVARERSPNVQLLLKKENHGELVSWSQSQLPNDQITNIFYYTPGCCQIWRDSEIDNDLYPAYTASIDPAERDALMGEILGIRYDYYAGKPVGIVPLQIAINPAVVAEYVFPGTITAKWVYMEYIPYAGE